MVVKLMWRLATLVSFGIFDCFPIRFKEDKEEVEENIELLLLIFTKLWLITIMPLATSKFTKCGQGWWTLGMIG